MPIPEDIVEELREVARRMGVSHYDLLSQLLYIYLRSSTISGDLPGVALESALLSYLKRYGLVLVPIRVLGELVDGENVGKLASYLREVARISTLALLEQGVIRDKSVVRGLFSSWVPGLPVNIVEAASRESEWRVVIASPDITGNTAIIIAGIVEGIVEGLGGRITSRNSREGVVAITFHLPVDIFKRVE